MYIRPPAQMVSKVNSSASMNSSIETSWTCFTILSARASASRSSQRWVSADPAPAIGLTIRG